MRLVGALTDGQSSQDALWSSEQPWEGKEVACARQKQAGSSHSLLVASKLTQSLKTVIPWACGPGPSKSSHSCCRETHTDDYREMAKGIKCSTENWKHKIYMSLLCIPYIWLKPSLGLSNKESACNAGDSGSIPGLGRSPGGRHGNPCQYCCLKNPMDKGAWWATVPRILESDVTVAT